MTLIPVKTRTTLWSGFLCFLLPVAAGLPKDLLQNAYEPFGKMGDIPIPPVTRHKIGRMVPKGEQVQLFFLHLSCRNVDILQKQLRTNHNAQIRFGHGQSGNCVFCLQSNFRLKVTAA